MGCDIHGWIEADSSKKRREDYIKFLISIQPQSLKAGIATQEEMDKRVEDERNKPIVRKWYKKINIENIVSRNYDAFALLFGVRRDRPEEHYGMPPVAENRGTPEDSDRDIIKESCETTDYHSYSYITLFEIKKIDWSKCQGKILEFCMMFGFKELFELMQVFSDGTDQNVRLVVWFDN